MTDLLAGLLADAVALAALAALLVAAILHLPWRQETAVAVAATLVVLAALVTAVLSLDATVVLLTPIVVGAAATLGTSDRPGAFACLRMANSGSLLFPVSTLTNLLALPYLSLDFIGFAVRMAPVLLVVLVVEYVGLRLLFRRDLTVQAPEHGDVTGPPMPVFPSSWSR